MCTIFIYPPGNYGNKLDENVPPSPSTTQPTNAVFDGCHYYFLPWAGTKPCVVVDCSWENISWRLESLNIILNILDRLVGLLCSALPCLPACLHSCLSLCCNACHSSLPAFRLSIVVLLHGCLAVWLQWH